MDTNSVVSLVNLKEDVLDGEVASSKTTLNPKGCAPITLTGKVKATKTAKTAKTAKTKKVKAQINPLERLLVAASKPLACTTSELSAWLTQSQGTPMAVQQNALRLITQYGLDPFADEIAIYQYEDRHWQAFITIDGWSKLMNRHPAFNGICFTQSEELVGGVPAWMGCAIYRHDRVVPIEVKEYFCEIQTEHSIWKEMPRRMLRHRVIAQCARLAFGVSVPEYQLNDSKLNALNKSNQPKSLSHAVEEKSLPLTKLSHVDLLKARLQNSQKVS